MTNFDAPILLYPPDPVEDDRVYCFDCNHELVDYTHFSTKPPKYLCEMCDKTYTLIEGELVTDYGNNKISKG